MLRISKHIDGPRARLELEGKLDDGQVRVLEAECDELLAAQSTVELELRCLRFADTAGVRALIRLRERGVRLVGATPLVGALLSRARQPR